MTYALGIDTGGTFTDAVIFEQGVQDPVRAKAKALTSHGALERGIAEAIDAVLGAGFAAEAISLVSLSTTLATNALVEGRGGRVGLVFIGFDERDEARADLPAALKGDPVIRLGGGHEPDGTEAAPLQTEALDAGLDAAGPVDGYAVVSRFGVRNPSHERQIRDLLRARTQQPVTCGHELSAALNGPRRALTTVLNARLIGLIDDLITKTGLVLAARGIEAPLMLVRGDGALVAADFARSRPIETILSGPAASLVGAATLTGVSDAVIADIGGTTTDIAVLKDGRPTLAPDGARVGGHRTLVEAVAIETCGLGGDSRVRVKTDGLSAHITLGPDRAIPISLLGAQWEAEVAPVLERQLARSRPSAEDAVFALAMPGAAATRGLDPRAGALLARLPDGPLPLEDLLRNRNERAALDLLLMRGAVRLAAFTPSDAAHVQGHFTRWSVPAAANAARLMARLRDGRGQPNAASGDAFSARVIELLVLQSAQAALSTALNADGVSGEMTPTLDLALRGHSGLARLSAGLSVPLVGLGAAAGLYYPQIATRLSTDAIIPAHADVANAIGAVAGQVRVRITLTVQEQGVGRYAILGGDTPVIEQDFEAARARAEALARDAAGTAAAEAGAEDPVIAITYTEKRAEIEGRSTLIEGRLIAEASGRPRLSM